MMDRLLDLVRRAHRRSLWQVVGIYLAGSWVAFEIVSTLTNGLDLPEWVPGVALALLVVGLPIVVATAFVQEAPPEESGIGNGAGSDAGSGGRPTPETGIGEATDADGEVGLTGSLLTWRNALLGGVMAFCVLFGVAGLVVLLQDGGGSLAPTEVRADEAAPGIAVLPFSVRGGDEFRMLREGMVDVLSHTLDGAAGLRAISNRTVLARWRDRAPGEEEVDLRTHLRVAREAGARYALVGSAVRLGEEARLVGEVYRVRTGERIASASVEGEAGDLGELVDRLAVETLKSLIAGDRTFPGVDVARVITPSPAALRAYLEGERHMRRFRQKQAAEAFGRALEADSAFALAHWRLVEVLSWGETLNPARRRDHLEAAYRHRRRLTDRAAFIAEALLAPTRAGVRMLRDAVRRYPDDATAWYRLGETLVHSPQLLPTAAEIARPFERALALDPRRPAFYPHAIALAMNHRRDSARAADLVRRYRELSRPQGPYGFDLDPRAGALALRLAFGDSAAGTGAIASLDTLPPGLIGAAGGYLRWPTHWPLAARLFEAHLRRGEPGELRLVSRRTLAHGRLLYDGRVREALALMREEPGDSGLSAAGEGFEWPLLLYRAHVAGLPVPDSVLTRLLDGYLHDPEATSRGVLAAGAWAYERGDHEALSRARSILEKRRDRFDSTRTDNVAETVRGRVELLEARVALGEGRTREALSVLEREAEGTWAVQWWLGEACLESGRYDQAARVFGTRGWSESYGPFEAAPPVRARRARALEGLGRDGEAARAYAYLAEHWSDGDPAARERARRARERAAALRGGGEGAED